MRVLSSQILPLVSVSSPARQFSAVDLPQPDGPSSAMNSPRLTVEIDALKRIDAAETAAHPLEPKLTEIACGDSHDRLFP